MSYIEIADEIAPFTLAIKLEIDRLFGFIASDESVTHVIFRGKRMTADEYAAARRPQRDGPAPKLPSGF